jgi:hypothetical protein
MGSSDSVGERGLWRMHCLLDVLRGSASAGEHVVRDLLSRLFGHYSGINDIVKDLGKLNGASLEARPPLILGLAAGYKKRQLEPFVSSLKQTSYSGQTIFFVSDLTSQTELFLENKGIELIRYDKNRFNEIHIQNARWFLYLEYLLGRLWSSTMPSAVFFTDVADVVFQNNPFADEPQYLEYFEESEKVHIGECEWNSRWLEDCFGQAVLKELADLQISCCGTVMASCSGAVPYLIEMVKIFERIPEEALLKVSDQAIHNYNLHRRAIPGAILRKNGERVFTVGYVSNDEFQIDAMNFIRTKYGRMSHVVHQYNRHDEMTVAIAKRLKRIKPFNPMDVIRRHFT